MPGIWINDLFGFVVAASLTNKRVNSLLPRAKGPRKPGGTREEQVWAKLLQAVKSASF
jgi:hypothetical protein